MIGASITLYVALLFLASSAPTRAGKSTTSRDTNVSPYRKPGQAVELLENVDIVIRPTIQTIMSNNVRRPRDLIPENSKYSWSIASAILYQNAVKYDSNTKQSMLHTNLSVID